jgi:hypothetical protein
VKCPFCLNEFHDERWSDNAVARRKHIIDVLNEKGGVYNQSSLYRSLARRRLTYNLRSYNLDVLKLVKGGRILRFEYEECGIKKFRLEVL